MASALSGYEVRYEEHAIPYLMEHYYVPDFTVYASDGTMFFIEVKGWFSPTDRRKMLAVRKHNPDADIRFVFANANKKLTKAKRSQTYADWCDRHGFAWASGGVPSDWLE